MNFDDVVSQYKRLRKERANPDAVAVLGGPCDGAVVAVPGECPLSAVGLAIDDEGNAFEYAIVDVFGLRFAVPAGSEEQDAVRRLAQGYHAPDEMREIISLVAFLIEKVDKQRRRIADLESERDELQRLALAVRSVDRMHSA